MLKKSPAISDFASQTTPLNPKHNFVLSSLDKVRFGSSTGTFYWARQSLISGTVCRLGTTIYRHQTIREHPMEGYGDGEGSVGQGV